MNSFIERWKKIRKIRKIQAGVFVILAIILVVVISQRLGILAETLGTISNTATLTFDDGDQTKTAQSNTVITDLVASPSPTQNVTPTPIQTPTPTPTPIQTITSTPGLTPTPTPTPTVITGGGGGGGGGYWYSYKMALAAKLAAAKKALINAKLLLIMKLKGAKPGAPTIDYVNISPNPAQVGQEIKFEVGWTDPNDKVKIYVCKANLMFNRACAKAYWCEYGPKDSSPAWCYYIPQIKDNYYNYFYVFACDESNKCTVGLGGNFRINK